MTFLIPCPVCGPREAGEFSYGGEISVRVGPDSSARELCDYLFFRTNASGWQTEWWLHRDGCRTWFRAERHTMTNEISKTWVGDGQESA